MSDLENLGIEKNLENPEMLASQVLIDAIHIEDYGTIKKILDDGIDVNIEAKNKFLPLFAAIDMNNTKITQMLIDKGANLEAKDERGATVLYTAVESCYKISDFEEENDAQERLAIGLASVQYLLEKGANVNIVTDVGDTPISCAFGEGYKEMIDLLLTYAADTLAGGAFSLKNTAFMNDNVDYINFLLDKGADINQNYGSGSALSHAAFQGFFDVVKCLYERGADLYLKDKDGNTAFNHAISQEYFEIAQYLLEKGVNINEQTHEGWTQLMISAYTHEEKSIRFLLEKGADADLKNDKGKTALDLAREELAKDGYDYDESDPLIHLIMCINKNRTHEEAFEEIQEKANIVRTLQEHARIIIPNVRRLQ